MEKAKLNRISQLLEFIERKGNHELLLSVRNMSELGVSSFLYIVSVLLRPMLNELTEGEHFVLSDLLKLIPGGSSQADSTPETFVWLDFLPLSAQDPKPIP